MRADLYPRGRLAVEVSLWSADLAMLGAEIDRIGPHADLFHLDASDTRFVPRPLFFPDLVAVLRPRSPAPFHVHLMAQRATGLAGQFVAAGADLVSVHAEADDVDDAVAAIRAGGAAAGLALRLDTPVQTAATYLHDVDAVVMVGTPLGSRGTPMAPHAPQRIDELRALTARAGCPRVAVVADGGIREDTAGPLALAGATAVVAGSLLFGSADPAATAGWLRSRPTSGHQPAAYPG